jgi:hypothetical protein
MVGWMMVRSLLLVADVSLVVVHGCLTSFEGTVSGG